MIEALIFDFDGLILDTETPELMAWQEVFAGFGCNLTIDTWADCVGRPPGSFDPCLELERQMGRRLDRERLRADVRARCHSLIDREAVRPGVVDWLDEAEAAGAALAVVSSSPHFWVDRHLEKLNLLDRFEQIVCREDVERHKPDPLPYQKAVERLGREPLSAIAVEDSPHGVRSAKAAGLWTVAVPNHVTRMLVFEGADLTLGSLKERSFTSAAEQLVASVSGRIGAR